MSTHTQMLLKNEKFHMRYGVKCYLSLGLVEQNKRNMEKERAIAIPLSTI